ncbi:MULTISPECIES: hemolysin family protein [Corynebacterium]|uniref:hemolysin family protein n=1 Tax=Corynebacterium TaxID=1716 RepID=UPI00124E21EB|nr:MULTISPECIES: hemolysin family protein [Corynebacterium]
MDILFSILALLGFVALTAGTGLFVAIEFALTGLERSTIDNHVAHKKDAVSQRVRDAHENLSFELSGAQLGITITTLATGYLAEPVLARFFTPLLELVGLSERAASPIALILALIVATFLSMIYGELVPKNMAITDPWATARVVVTPVQWFNKALKWFITALNSSANFIVRKLGIEPADELASARSAQELGALVRNSAQVGTFDVSKARMIDRALKFGEATAEEFMTPRSTILFLHSTDSVEDLVQLALESGHSRFPVVDDDLDDTIGVVHIKNAFSIPTHRRPEVPVAQLAREVNTVPDSLDGDAVLNAVRSAGSQMVLVADEYGGTAGIVTIEDVVEELLGEVYDEHDDAEAEKDFRRVGDSWEVAGLVRVDELAEAIGYAAPDDHRYETVGGLIMTCLGRIPQPGDVVLLPLTEHDMRDEFETGMTGRWIASVAAMDDRRVERAFFTSISNEEAAEYAS